MPSGAVLPAFERMLIMSKKLKPYVCGALIVLIALIISCIVYLTVNAISFAVYSGQCREAGLIPRLDITTEGGAEIVSKEDYVGCTVTLGGSDITEASAGIRGRGNTTWEFFPKKPYRIKFDEKTSLFGESKNKSWVLLALYNDFSLSKDRLAFTLADAIGTESFVPSYNYVELYLNGDYKGLYLLTDQVDENKGRTEVKDDDFLESGAAEVPFLVELDAYAPDEGVEDVDWFSVGGRAYTVKYPEADERYSDAQMQYIKEYIERVEICANAHDLDALCELVDIESFIDYYIISEVMGQPEINWKSVYMHKAVGERMKMGPLWDFDWAAMGPEMDSYKGDTRGLRSVGNWFELMLSGSPEFCDMVNERFTEIEPKLKSAIQNADGELEALVPYFKKNHLKWHWFRPFTNPERRFNELTEWLGERIQWLGDYFGEISSEK